MEGCPDAPGDKYAADSHVLCDRNFNVACETGIRYPTLPAMLNSDALLIRISVRSIPCCRTVVLGYTILSWVIPFLQWDILIDGHLCRAPIAT